MTSAMDIAQISAANFHANMGRTTADTTAAAQNKENNMQRVGFTPGKSCQFIRKLVTNCIGLVLGPGSYNVTNGFDQIHRDKESAKTLQALGLD